MTRIYRAGFASVFRDGINDVEAETVFFSALMVAWLVLPAVVGLKSVLDAGSYFMLVTLGIVVVVDLAHHGLAPQFE